MYSFLYYICFYQVIYFPVISLFLLCRFGPPCLIEYVPKHTGNHIFMVLKVDDLIMFVMVTLVENIRISVMLSVSINQSINFLFKTQRSIETTQYRYKNKKQKKNNTKTFKNDQMRYHL